MDIANIPIRVLVSARQRLGAKSERDTSKDEIIKNATPKQIIAWYTGWVLGDEGWGETIIDYYEKVKEADNAQ